MTPYICATCGLQYPPTSAPPAVCTICTESRQYVAPEGQAWITPAQLRRRHANHVAPVEPGLHAIHSAPRFAIGQRAFLVETGEGNILWDCVTLLDEPTEARVRELGGLAAIAICHPHYYAAMARWSEVFGCPVYVHAADRRWVVYPADDTRYFETDTLALPGGCTLVRTGGHFAGSTVLHWPAGAAGRGVLLTGDSLKTTSNLEHVSFVRSSPNDLPLSADDADEIVRRLEPYAFDRLYSFRRDMVLPNGAKDIVRASAKLHREALAGRYPGGTALANR